MLVLPARLRGASEGLITSVRDHKQQTWGYKLGHSSPPATLPLHPALPLPKHDLQVPPVLWTLPSTSLSLWTRSSGLDHS